MSSRADERQAFLARAGYGDCPLAALPSDASERTYHRLQHTNEQALLLMDAPPDKSLGTPEFVVLSDKLLEKGIVAPEVVGKNLDQGFLLISDLGYKTAKAHLDVHPDDEIEVYEALTDLLLLTETITAPDLPVLDAKEAGDALAVTADFYLRDPTLTQPLADLMTEAYGLFCATDYTFALRDYHVENAIWRPDQAGLDRIGVLDFQDAVLAPKGYDLVSLLRDARRDLSDTLTVAMTARYVADHNLSAEFQPQFHCLALQRNLKILGIFARLALNPQKRRYLQFQSRVLRMVHEDTERLCWAPMTDVIRTHFPLDAHKK